MALEDEITPPLSPLPSPAALLGLLKMGEKGREEEGRGEEEEGKGEGVGGVLCVCGRRERGRER